MIHVRFTKWDGSLHWNFEVARLGNDGHGTWLGGRSGTPVRRGLDEPILSPAFALLVPQREHFTATWNAAEAGAAFAHEVYVDICTPARWVTPQSVTMVDLDLDVSRSFAGEVAVHDEDEFAEHAEQFDYPGDLIVEARHTVARIVELLESRTEPFGEVGAAWLAKVA
jgi:protein associated with RNAse G/E